MTRSSLPFHSRTNSAPASLAEPEEAMTVPVGSGHRLGDLRQAAKGLAIPRKAVLEDHDPLELAIHSRTNSAPALRLTPFRV